MWACAARGSFALTLQNGLGPELLPKRRDPLALYKIILEFLLLALRLACRRPFSHQEQLEKADETRMIFSEGTGKPPSKGFEGQGARKCSD